MKLVIHLCDGEQLILEDCCEHDLSVIRCAMDCYHRRWLKRLKPHTVEINSGSSRHIVLTKSIRSVGLIG